MEVKWNFFHRKTCLFTSLLHFLVYRLFTWCTCQCFFDVIDCRLIETKKQQQKKKLLLRSFLQLIKSEMLRKFVSVVPSISDIS